MPEIDEFGLIARLFLPLTAGHPGALQLKDDAALLAGPGNSQWVVTTDAMVAGVHFFPDDPPDLIARKLLRVNLSDLASMGAEPCVAFLAACFPKTSQLPWLDSFAAGMKSDCENFGLALLGGDTVATPGPLTLSLTALGQLPAGEALLRSNARSGDDIWVSGTIGDAALGLLVFSSDRGLMEPHRSILLDRYRLPQPRLALGQSLRGVANAVMDISDGLIGDLAHICKASSVGAIIEAAKIPLSASGSVALAAGFGDGLATILTGGDDYELLFTAPPQAAASLRAKADVLELQLTRIGKIIEGSGVIVQGAQGQVLPIANHSFRHFVGEG